MGYIYPKRVALSSESAQRPTKRHCTDKGKQPVRVTFSTEAGAAIPPEPPTVPALPGGFPSPPAGYEKLFEAWADMWRESHGAADASGLLQTKLFRFVKAAEALRDNEDSTYDNAMMIENKALEIQQGVVDDLSKDIRELQKRLRKLIIDATMDTSNPNAVIGRLQGLIGTGLTSPLELLRVDKHKKPSLHSVRSALADPRWSVDCRFVRAVDYFQEELLEQHHELLRHVFPPKSEDPASHQDPRWLENEHKIGPFFRAEVFKRAKIIVEELHSGAKVFAVDRHPTNGADMFVYVCIRTAADIIIKTNAIVKFMLPPGLDRTCQLPIPSPSVSLIELLAYDAAFSSSRFESALRQAYVYARDRTRILRNTLSVNTRFAFVSTFNGLWILQISSGSNDQDSVAVSPCFAANNTTPHVSFAVAYVLHLVIEDMMARPENYAPPVSDLATTEDKDSMAPQPPRCSGNSCGSHGSRSRSGHGRGTRTSRRTTWDPIATRMSDTANTSEHAELAAYYSAAAERISGNFTSSDSSSSGSDMEGSRIWLERTTSWQPLKGKISVGRALGDGRSGTVCEGWLQGHRVAFKISATDATAEILDEIHNEVQVYEHLADLQGSVIPRLLDHGLVNIHGRLHAVLALELVQDDKSARCPPQAHFAAIDALREIHRRGVVHGDPRIENIIFQQSSAAGRSGLRPRIIDLAFAMVNAPEQAMAKDFKGWCEVLKLPPECV
ncbi:hypothetical protein COEREDRAFT_7360 [Coemansia reversa NRRL 1564]|uniref:Protein kinase domain-containing protein n=1 Tax=Coemansia reversa (strain ATCC 12441 / NRRL 1564) TaxID=763665 RepID=A0A2G5BEG0_COERN|nr:hypothetical protein COEREDRAFT_7360 [Coemansia reversa NRRL 1564]|eukprot:PIA17394.1 hypothetical protein COEREDRAFT_7360 [Coemansia reversa NRRL 1564]